MKKILMSLVVIAAAVSIAVVGLSGAWFSEIESTEPGATSPGANMIYTGVIELDDINPMATIQDLKPCFTDWGYIVVHVAETSNSGNAWLHIANVIGEEDSVTEAEQAAYDEFDIRNDVERYVTVDVYIDPSNDVQRSGGQFIITDDMDWKLAELDCLWIPLGQLEPCTFYEVWLSFHLQEEAGNLYQADKVSFDLEVLLQQTNAPDPDPQWPSDQRLLRLENKNAAGWIVLDDDMFGILTFDCKAQTFNYNFEGYGLQDVNYSLIYYADPWPGNNPGALIGSGLASGGNLTLSGNVELGMDLPSCPADANCALGGAKIWLVTSSDYSGTSMTGWNPTNYLYETRLINYDDTGV